MAELKFLEVRCGEEKELALLAERLWHSAYDGLLGEAQVEYMTQKFQSAAAIKEQTEKENYIYFFIADGDREIGYCAVRPLEDSLFLSKLYLEEECRGRGVGQRALAQVCAIAKRLALPRVWLTVNKGNARAIRAYEKFGFVRTDSTVTDIGGGYAMDDYIYEYAV